MEFYFAPMEGITGYIYRNAHHAFFPGMDKYFTPFLSPNQNRALNPKERKDILQENNKGMYVVPQILTNRAEYFLRAAKELKEDYGYGEVNLNLGCPSGTVVSKGKGAGFLAKPEELDGFFDAIFAKVDVKVSVKTRIGIASPEEFYRIMEIFNRYPLHELVIHPRVQKDFYKNKPNREIFAEAVRTSRNPLCYNGDIFTVADYGEFREVFPMVGKLMIGRGLLVNPALVQRMKAWEEMGASGAGDGVADRQAGVGNSARGSGQAGLGNGAGKSGLAGIGGCTGMAGCGGAFAGSLADKKTVRDFHDRLYAEYKEVLSGDTNLLFKMKELWSYMVYLFNNYEKYWKKMKKVSRLGDYNEIVGRLFAEQGLR